MWYTAVDKDVLSENNYTCDRTITKARKRENAHDYYLGVPFIVYCTYWVIHIPVILSLYPMRIMSTNSTRPVNRRDEQCNYGTQNVYQLTSL